MEKKRFNEIDALRGIAALVVVIFHYSTRYEEIFGHAKVDYVTIFSFGHYGVQLFFIISGFVIYMSILKVSSIKDFVIKRSIRLYPSYIIAVVITFLVVSVSTLDNLKVSIPDALVNLTMFQGFIPGVDTVDGVYWSLRVELTFYIFMAFLLALKLEKKVMMISIVWLIGSVAIQLLHSISDSHLTLLLESFSISKYSQLFIIGMMFYSIWKHSGELKYHLMIVICLVYDFVFEGTESGLFAALFVAAFYLVIYGKIRILNSRVLIFFGTISYPLYLLHQFIGYVIIEKMETAGLTHEIFIVIPFAISVLSAYVLYRFAEQPIQKFLISKYSGWKKRKVEPKNVVVYQQ